MTGARIVNIALGRKGGPGGEWSAIALDVDGEQRRRIESGPVSSPGEALESIGHELDRVEAAAIVARRRGVRR